MLWPSRLALCTFALAAAVVLPVSGQIQPASPAASPKLNGIASVTLRVKDLAASVDFYHKLGFDHAFDTKHGDAVTASFIKINDTQFIELDPADGNQPAFLHLCLEAADLTALHDAYVATGLTPTAVHTPGDGNLLFTIAGPAQSSGPQNIEYTQSQAGSLLSKDAGQHLSPDRVGDKLTVVALAMQDPAAARSFYLDKLGFRPSAANAARLDLPGGSGESVEIVPAAELGSRASIVLNSPDIDKAEAQLKRQQVAYQRAASSSTDAAGQTRSLQMIAVTDPDGNIIRIAQLK